LARFNQMREKNKKKLSIHLIPEYPQNTFFEEKFQLSGLGRRQNQAQKSNFEFFIV
jgi:hypothetical protein